MYSYNIGNTAQFAAHALLEYYSVSLPKNQHTYVSMHTDYLSILTKNLTSQSAHLNCTVLPIEITRGCLQLRAEIIPYDLIRIMPTWEACLSRLFSTTPRRGAFIIFAK